MKPKLLPAIALFCSLVALALLLSHPSLRPTTFYIAKTDLPAGTRLTPQFLQAVQVQTGTLPGTHVAKNLLLGRRLRISVTRGTLLSPSLVAKVRQAPPLFAVTLPVTAAARPGMLLDILQLGTAAPPRLIASGVTVIQPSSTGVSSGRPQAIVAVPLPLAEALAGTPKGQSLLGVIEESPQ